MVRTRTRISVHELRQSRILEPGCIVAFTGRSCLARAIRVCTCGGKSHAALLADDLTVDRLLLYESSMSSDTTGLTAQRRVKGVQDHEPMRYLRRHLAAGGKAWIYRPVQPLTMAERLRLAYACRDSLGTPYDWRGAWRVRVIGFGWLVRLIERRHPAWLRWLLPDVEHNGRLFCNEAVAVWLRIVGRLKRESASRYSPSTFLRAQVEDGLYQKPVEVVR